MATYHATILATPNLVNYWPLSEAGVPFVDIGPGGINMTNSNGVDPLAPSLVPTQPADASVHGNGGAAPGGLTSAANYTWPAALSIEAWVKPSVVWSNIGIAGAWTGGAGSMLSTPVGATSRIRFYTGGAFIDSGFDVPNNTVAHIVGTYDGANRSIYINGALAAGPIAGASPAGTFALFEIGNYVGSGVPGAVGWIDDVSTYSRALTAVEVLAHYNAGVAAGGGAGSGFAPRFWS